MSAHFSDDGLYRYIALRALDNAGGPNIGFLMHNPSIAGEQGDEDRTSRRVIGFGQRFGAAMVALLNPWAGIATKPRNLWEMDDPVGPENLAWIAHACKVIRDSGGFWIVAWGAVSPPRALRPAALAHLRGVEAMITASGCEMFALGLTAAGEPRHPLYVKADAPLIPWPVKIEKPTVFETYLKSFGELK